MGGIGDALCQIARLKIPGVTPLAKRNTWREGVTSFQSGHEFDAFEVLWSEMA